MSRKTSGQEARRQAALERLGSIDPRCASCGESDWRCLEAHHLSGEKYASDTVPVCRNCHRKLSDAQQDHPKGINAPPSRDELIGRFLVGAADFLALLIEKLRDFGNQLIESARLQRLEGGLP